MASLPKLSGGPYRLREITVGGVQCAQITQLCTRELLIAEAG
jgi:hypothetical protein